MSHMIIIRNLRFTLCILLILNCVICVPNGSNEDNKKQKGDGSNEDNKKQKEESDLPEDESDEKDLGTISPSEMENLKKEIIEIQEENAEKFGLPLTSSPDDIDTFLDKEEKEYGEELPEILEEVLTDKGELKNLVHFLELFDKINDGTSEGEEEKEEKPKSPEEMHKMKEELFELLKKDLERNKLSKISYDEYDKVWKQKEKEYGKKFPTKIEKIITLLKNTEDKEEFATSEKTISEEITEVSTHILETTEAAAPKDTFALRNAKGKICILAKFNSTIIITYPGKMAEQKVEVTVPHNAHLKGKCGNSVRSPQLDISWERFMINMFFDKISDDSWAVKSIEMNYDTSEPLFDGAVNREKVTAKTKKTDFFITPLGKSYFCSNQESVLLYSDNQHVATMRINESHLQPYDIKDGKFSESHHCNQVVNGLDEEPFVQDETVPLAVGCTLALITLIILVGFSVHRAYQAAKVDYNEMP